ncbi:MAG: nucleotide sugar dehydrogenase, partial [Chloroflexi bacterium]
AESIVPCLRKGNLVVLESTSPPRTTVDVVAPILESSGLRAGQDFHLAYTPERVLPGQILRELIENARVIGGIDRSSAEAGCDLYNLFVRGDIILTDATTAEMVKLMENTSRDVNIAIANEFSRLADRFGVDIWEAIELANRHPRVNILRPGPGVGGHCISVDPWFFVGAAPDISQLIKTARIVNDAQPQFVVDLFKRAFHLPDEMDDHVLEGKRVGLLGLSYKSDVDDLRESPAVEVAHLLQKEGAIVTAYEPLRTTAQLSGLQTVLTLEEALKGADIIGIMVAHTPFKELTPERVTALTSARKVVDTVNIWNRETWEPAGFQVIRLGDGKNRTGHAS